MACRSVLNGGIGIDCDGLIGGVADRLILINYDDKGSETVDTDFPDGNVFSAFSLKSGGKVGYLFEGKGNASIVIRQNPIVNSYGQVDGYTHEVDFVAFKDDPIALAQLERIARAKMMAIAESNGLFWILGFNSGLFASSIATDTSNADARGAGTVSLISKTEPRLKRNLGVWTGTYPAMVHDYNASKALFDGLLTPTS